MSQFDFLTNDEAEAYCQEIAEQMIIDFGITKQEAIGRINRLWAGLDMSSNSSLYTEGPVWWAWHIYYGPESMWWIQRERSRKEEFATLKAQALPLRKTPRGGTQVWSRIH